MKILFLDIDGVLNSYRTVKLFGGYPYDFTPAHKRRFDWQAVQLISNLCRETQTHIVLSSTWRKHFTHAVVGRELGLPIVDATPILNTSRGVEINKWLVDHGPFDKYAIVDDDSDMLPEQMPRFVQTSMAWGLRQQEADQLRALLA